MKRKTYHTKKRNQTIRTIQRCNVIT